MRSAVLPPAVHLLAVAVFAQATSEFMLAGLVPPIAADLAVPTSAAGALTSAFAAGMIVGAPLVAVLARRFPPRVSLAVFLVVFVAVHVLGALTPSFGVLVATRVVAALANAGFLAVALSVVVRLAPPGRTGRATSVLLAGTTLACVAGVPAGAVLGQVFGWRSAFLAVAALALPALLGVLAGVPRSVGDAPAAAAGVRDELRVLRRSRPARSLVVAALVNAATFGSFTYLAVVLTDVSGLAPAWVPAALALFGVGTVVGVTAAGRLADRVPGTAVAVGGTALVAGWATFALVAGSTTAALFLTGALGAVSFLVGATVVARALAESADAPTLGGSYATVAFNVGAVVGPVAAGVALDASGSARGVLWVSAVLALAGLVVARSGSSAQPSTIGSSIRVLSTTTSARDRGPTSAS